MAQGRTSPPGPRTLGNFGPFSINLLTFCWAPWGLQEEEPKPAVWGRIFGFFWGFLPCAWEAIKSFFPSFGEEFASCSVFPVLCSLLSSQPELRSSRDAPMSLFHGNVSFQAPAFAFWLEEISVYSICSPCFAVCAEQTHLKPQWSGWSGAFLADPGFQPGSKCRPVYPSRKYPWISTEQESTGLGLIREVLTEGISDFRLSSDSWNKLQLSRRNQQEWSMDRCEQGALCAGHSSAALLFKYFL